MGNFQQLKDGILSDSGSFQVVRVMVQNGCNNVTDTHIDL